MVTVVLVDIRVSAAQAQATYDPVAQARTHRPHGYEELCAACGWHWPCPAFFQARHTLIRAGVPPAWWALDEPSSRHSERQYR